MSSPTVIMRGVADIGTHASADAAEQSHLLVDSADRRAPMVLHVRVVTGTGGGPEKTILNSPRFLRQLGYQSKIAYLHPPGDPGLQTLRSRADVANAELISIPDRGPFDLSVIKSLVQVCRKENVAIWHGHDYKSNVLGLIVRLFWRMKLVTTLHGWTNLSGRMPLYVHVDKWCLKHYRAAICVSDDLIHECKKCGVPAERRHLIYNAIDTMEYRRTMSSADAKQRIGFKEDGLLIGAVGRLSKEKAFDLLIQAVARLRGAGHRISLWIAGEGPAREELQRLISELNCGEFVLLIGHVEDPKVFYQAMDVYALSSIREGLPNVVLEAMAMEIPVVATRVAGVPKLVDEGTTGLLVDAGSLDQFVDGIQRLTINPTMREAMGRAARVRIETLFSFQRRMEKMVSVYDDVLNRSA